MKKKVILIISLLSIFLMGCSDKKIESKLVEEGKALLESSDYSQAMKILSSALEEDESDEYARSMYMQAMKMKNVDDYIHGNNYKKAIDELKIIENIKSGSSKIKEKASNLLKELEDKYEKEQKLAQERKENAKTVATNSANKVNQQILKEEEEVKKAEEAQQQELENSQLELESNQSQLQNTDNTQNTLDQVGQGDNNIEIQQ